MPSDAYQSLMRVCSTTPDFTSLCHVNLIAHTATPHIADPSLLVFPLNHLASAEAYESCFEGFLVDEPVIAKGWKKDGFKVARGVQRGLSIATMKELSSSANVGKSACS